MANSFSRAIDDEPNAKPPFPADDEYPKIHALDADVDVSVDFWPTKVL